VDHLDRLEAGVLDALEQALAGSQHHGHGP
jgi:hypothetical protein